MHQKIKLQIIKQNMIIQKLITYFTFPLLYTTNKTIKDKYIIILDKALKMPTKLNKTSILAYLLELYKDLTSFIVENKILLSRKEKSYINALRNLILQLRRYFTIQSSKEFPNLINTLEDKELLLGIEELSKEKKISKEITLLSKPFIFDYKVLQPKRKGINPFKKNK